MLGQAERIIKGVKKSTFGEVRGGQGQNKPLWDRSNDPISDFCPQPHVLWLYVPCFLCALQS